MAEESLLVEEKEQESQSWYSEEQKELVEKQGWKGPTDVVRDYGELLKSASAKIKMPTPESSAEEISNFYARMGRPENPEGYEIDRPELPEGMAYDENFENTMRGIAHEIGITKAQMKNLVNAYNEYQIERFNTESAELTKTYEEGKAALQSDWKEDYKANLEVAKRACRELGGEDFVALLEENKIGNNPIFVKTFYNIGTKILNDTLIKGTQGGGEEKEEYKPAYPDSPEMYANDTSPEGEKARLYFTKRGHIY